MKKVIMVLTAIVPAIVLNMAATTVLPMIFGDAIIDVLPWILVAFAGVTLGITILVFNKKKKQSCE